MDGRIEPIEASKRYALLRDIQAVGAPSLESLHGQLVAAEARGDTERASAVRADIETIALWLAWAAREGNHREHGRARTALIAIDAFAGVSALLGMAILLADWPIRFPAAWLQRTPFSDYIVPALILGLVVGGSALVAMGTTIRRVATGPVLSLLAGMIMIGWIVGEVLLLDRAMPPATYWAQAEYLLVGLAMVALALRAVRRDRAG